MFSYSPTGRLYASPTFSPSFHKLNLCTDGSFLHQLNPTPLSALRPDDGWPLSIEPEEHLDLIATQIRQASPVAPLLCFSSKDVSLAHRLTDEPFDILFDLHSGIIRLSPEDALDNLETYLIQIDFSEYKLFLCRHYIEHLIDPSILINAFCSTAMKDSLFYVEVPDCGGFLNLSNPLFLWEQHRSYFSFESFRLWLIQHHISLQFYSSYGDSIEPSLCSLFSISNDNRSDSPNCSPAPLYVNQNSFLNFYNSWNRFFMSHLNSTNIGFGIGHNFDRFLQLLSAQKYFDIFLDANPCKHGLYLSCCSKPITSSYIPSDDTPINVFIGAHDRNFDSAAQAAKALYPTASIYSIFKIP